MLEARSGDGAIKSFPRIGVKSKMAAPVESSTGLQNKTFHCEICDVHVNSETQLKQVGSQDPIQDGCHSLSTQASTHNAIFQILPLSLQPFYFLS